MLFGSPADKAHLEKQVPEADGILFGTGTFKGCRTAMTVSAPELLEQRERLREEAIACTD